MNRSGQISHQIDAGEVFTASTNGGKWALTVEREGAMFSIRELKHGHAVGGCCNYTREMVMSWLHQKFHDSAKIGGIHYQITRNKLSFTP